MNKFLLRKVLYKDIKRELSDIGFDDSYQDCISEKFRAENIRIYNLTPAQANILKQTALIYGADCAVNKNVITGTIDRSDAILCGSYSQLKKIAAKLKGQPCKLALLSDSILKFLSQEKRTTKLVGILNVTPDSFSDGGLYYDSGNALKHLEKLISDGADVIDIGAESTRPYFEPVSPKEQIRRLKPILELNWDIPISVDTRSSEVADFALNSGAQIINDVSGLEYDKNMAKVIARYGASVIIQHSCGNTESTPSYNNIVEDVFFDLKQKIEFAKSIGIENIIADPGIGFGKNRIDNLNLLDNAETFFALNCPIMIGISRKSVLNVKDADNETKDAITLAYSYPLILSGIDYLRVHNVKLHRTLLNSLPN